MESDSSAGPSDLDLAARCAAGDRDAGNVLLGRYQRPLYLVCRRITGHEEDALDALQDTLVNVWRNIGSFRGESLFSSWVYRIATNAALAHVQRRQRHSPPASAAPDHARGPEDRVIAHQTVDWALGRLPPQFRAAVLLRDILDLPYEEVAAILDVPLNTAKTRISRGRQALVELLGVTGEEMAASQ